MKFSFNRERTGLQILWSYLIIIIPITNKSFNKSLYNDISLSPKHCLDYVLRTSIDKIRENGFELTKKRSKWYPAKTIVWNEHA